jgi:hypothetical protein
VPAVNDLDLVRTMRAAAPIPSEQRLDAGRERLLAAVGSPSEAPRTVRPGTRMRALVRWTAIAGGLATAAGAVAFAVSGGFSPAPSPGAGLPSTSPNSGQPMSTRQVLLVAATNAERQPATDGAYWRVSMLHEIRTPRETSKEIIESWYGKDGRYWAGLLVLNGAKQASRPATLTRIKEESSRAFELADHQFSLAQIRGLPTAPEDIEKWANKIALTVFSRQQDIDGYTDDLLGSLLAEAPATPKTRAAAFRALARRPGVKSAGRAKDEQGRAGYALIISGKRYLIDPSTATLLSENTITGPRRAATTYLNVGWTNENPRPPARP